MFKSYEEQYMDILNNVMTNGSENINKRTGVGTKRIPNAVINAFGVDMLGKKDSK